MKKEISFSRSQQGLTLIEAVAFLAILGMVVAGALAMFGGASSSQKSTSLVSQLTALRTSTQQMWTGQGTYGSASLNATLITANRVPSNLKVATPNITNQDNGAVIVTGATSQFTISTANHPADVCTSAVAALGSQNYPTIAVGATVAAATAVAQPITPTAAATACANAANAIVLTSS